MIKNRDEVEVFICSIITEPEVNNWFSIIPEPTTARSAVPGVSPGRGLLIPHGYLHTGKSEHSEVKSPSIIAGASLCSMGGPPTDLKNMTDYQEWKG